MLAGVGTAIGGITLAGCIDDSGTDAPEDDDGPDDTSGDDSGTDGTEGADDDSGTDGPDDDSGTDGPDDEPGGPDDGSDGPGCADETVHESYEETSVQIATADGDALGSVTAAIADTSETRQTGLSETECLPADRGMLFVYDEVRSRTFWMINMDFGIDIIYVDDEGFITAIHHAEAPADDESGTEEHHQYRGEGQYVLEVNYGWTTERGIEVGDVITRQPK